MNFPVGVLNLGLPTATGKQSSAIQIVLSLKSIINSSACADVAYNKESKLSITYLNMGAHKLKVVTPVNFKDGDPAQGFDVEVYLDDRKLEGVTDLQINIGSGSKVVKATMTVAISDLEYDLKTHVDIQDLDSNPATIKAVEDFEKLLKKKNEEDANFIIRVASPK